MCDVYRNLRDTWRFIYVVSRIRRDAFSFARYECGFRRMKFESYTLLLRQYRHHSHHEIHDKYHYDHQKQQLKNRH